MSSAYRKRTSFVNDNLLSQFRQTDAEIEQDLRERSLRAALDEARLSRPAATTLLRDSLAPAGAPATAAERLQRLARRAALRAKCHSVTL